jgi:DNA-binding CsgD family transcriptional regulator
MLLAHTGVVGGRACEIQLYEVRPGNGARLVALVRSLDEPAPEPFLAQLRARYGLSRRQAEVARLLRGRRSDKEIAATLGVALPTAQNHVKAVRARLGGGDRRTVACVLAELTDWDGAPARPQISSSER